MPVEENKAVARRYYNEVIGRGDATAIAEVLAGGGLDTGDRLEAGCADLRQQPVVGGCSVGSRLHALS
jgi:hypothetical protein